MGNSGLELGVLMECLDCFYSLRPFVTAVSPLGARQMPFETTYASHAPTRAEVDTLPGLTCWSLALTGAAIAGQHKALSLQQWPSGIYAT